MDKEVKPAGAASVDEHPARTAVSASQGRKKPNITVTTRSVAETGRTKTDDNGNGRPRPRRVAPMAPPQGEKVEPAPGVSPAPKDVAAASDGAVADGATPGGKVNRAIESMAKARQEAAASVPVTVVRDPGKKAAATAPGAAPAPATSAQATPAVSTAPAPPPPPLPSPSQSSKLGRSDAPSGTRPDTEERFPFLSEGHALETTVGEAILQAAAVLGVPEDAVAADTLLVRRNLRSGQQLRHYGNVVIIGDVNAGAEVIATGDIIVVGALRGLAHAGAVGNEDSIVAAYYLRPTQLRVANYIGRAPDQPERNYQGPEVARVRSGRVVVEPYRVLAGRDL